MENPVENLMIIQRILLEGDFDFSHYRTFKIFDPKERVISAASFQSRVIQQAVILVCGPYMERPLIADTYACRKGFGQWAAVFRDQDFYRRFDWALKMDMRHYFDSIDHEIALGIVYDLFREAGLRHFWEEIVTSYSTAPGKGVPIGNLTSQYLANLYLATFDRFCQGKHRRYVRYMDDVLVLGDYEDLKALKVAAAEFLDRERKLEIKNGGSLQRTSNGMEFLGCPLLKGGLGLARRSRRRLHRKLSMLNSLYEKGVIDGEEYRDRYQAVIAFPRQTGSYAMIRRAMGLYPPLTWLSPKLDCLLRESVQNSSCVADSSLEPVPGWEGGGAASELAGQFPGPSGP